MVEPAVMVEEVPGHVPDMQRPAHACGPPGAVVAVLRCPVCGTADGRLLQVGGALRCSAGHLFDVARQGYVNLLAGRAPAGAETPAMVAARAELFDAGHLAAVTTAVVAAVREASPRPATPAPTASGSAGGLVLDVGAGTGHHLAAVLHARPGDVGVALDVSKAAARHSARAHPAIGSIVADARHAPLASGCVDVVLDVFAPRHGPELRRVLRPDGALVVVTPTPEHLAELVGPLGLLTVDPAKAERVERSLGHWFEAGRTHLCRYRLALTREGAARFVAMGPSAWHTTPGEVAGRLGGWSEPITVTISVEVTVYRPRS
jgi:23S rRNA (guanine745-N1)-methyltransferase